MLPCGEMYTMFPVLAINFKKIRVTMRTRVAIADSEERYVVTVQIVRECKVVLFETNFKAELQQDFVQGMDERFDLFKVKENKYGGCVMMARIEKEESAEEIVMDTMQIFENSVAL